MTRSVLIIEDEPEIVEVISTHLQDEEFDVSHDGDGVSGLVSALNNEWDLLLIDRKLPRLDGIEICQKVRQYNSQVPIILVSAKSSESERIEGLNVGADDYISKPFSVLEMVARIHAVFRRVDAPKYNPHQDRIVVCDIVLDKRTHEVVVSGKVISLTPREFDLLACFTEAPGRVFKRQDLLETVWGYNHSGYLHTVNTHINRLRCKLEKDPANPVYIKTVWGVGYKFQCPD